MKDTIEFLNLRIEAQRLEIERLNNELRLFKELASKTRLSDPNFDKPLSEIKTNFEIIEFKK